ncbi:hypothetical protein AURDEDRAFT_170327 [Auricularia subglabra TFB-10046 SS5]|nr:hypothetical protein AURDEDRAFT_170327 [Auricularia subglabra TFB-10046 SS5]
MLVILFALLAATHVCVAARTHWFAFGDSYTTTAFQFKGKQPNDVNPMGNPPLPGGTACGKKPNWVYYNALKYNSSQVYVYDFAFGGATIDRKVIPPATREIRTFGEQIEQFAKGYSGDKSVNKVTWNGKEALFSTFFGINDIGLGSYHQNINQSVFHTKLMDSYMAGMRRLFALGARNFLILNVPPTDRSPMITKRGAKDAAKYKAAVADYNNKLRNRVAIFQKNHPKACSGLHRLPAETHVSQAVARVVDIHTAIGELLDHPKKYGFRDAKTYGSDKDLVWCNDYHISPGAHEYLAKALRTALNKSNTNAFCALKDRKDSSMRCLPSS